MFENETKEWLEEQLALVQKDLDAGHVPFTLGLDTIVYLRKALEAKTDESSDESSESEVADAG